MFVSGGSNGEHTSFGKSKFHLGTNNILQRKGFFLHIYIASNCKSNIAYSRWCTYLYMKLFLFYRFFGNNNSQIPLNCVDVTLCFYAFTLLE